MDASMGKQTWRQFSDPHGKFHVEVPDSWQVEQSHVSFTHGQRGQVWQGHTLQTTLLPPAGDTDERRMSVTIRIDEYAATPSRITKDRVEPTDLSFLHTYRITHDEEWLSCTLGQVRVHIQYELQGVSRAYQPLSWEPPAPLSSDERRQRVELVQHIIDSFDLLVLG